LIKILPTFLVLLVVLSESALPVEAQASPNLIPAIQKAETKEHRDSRMAWWREARFGMFIHWGIYSVPAHGEWYMYHKKVPVATYAAFARQFNPTKFDAEAWAQLAQDAGMKYMVITAKHHDGFSMFPTKATNYNIADATPYQHDVLAELAKACRKRGIKFGIYYSIGLDWHHPGGDLWRAQPWDPAQVGDNEKFVQTIPIPECQELLERYHPDLWWWDGSGKTWSPEHPDRAAQLQKIFASFSDLIINNRMYDAYRNDQFKPGWFADTGNLVENFVRGDYATPEGTVPATTASDLDWETCDTTNNSWGYNAEAKEFKTPENLVRRLVDVASKGGNYLLNVGPTSEGVIPSPEIDDLRAIGAWLRVNGESIYGTGRAADGVSVAQTSQKTEWRCTTKTGKIYIHLFTWPGATLVIDGIHGPVTKAFLLADPAHKPLNVKKSESEEIVSLPMAAPDNINSVLCLETASD
jgi:alpha-L-fucosidase